MRSGRSGAVPRGPCTARMAATTAMTPASTPNRPPAPATTMTTPASAGPAARATLTETFVMATAGASSWRGTRSGTVAEKAGRNIANPAPSAAVAASTTAGVAAPRTVNTGSAVSDRVMAKLAATSRRRRSSTSATAPAKSESTTPGTLIAVWMSATSAAVPDWLVMTSTAATGCAQMTTCAARKASHATRKRASRSGASDETARGVVRGDNAIASLRSEEVRRYRRSGARGRRIVARLRKPCRSLDDLAGLAEDRDRPFAQLRLRLRHRRRLFERAGGVTQRRRLAAECRTALLEQIEDGVERGERAGQQLLLQPAFALEDRLHELDLALHRREQLPWHARGARRRPRQCTHGCPPLAQQVLSRKIRHQDRGNST